MRWGLFVDVAAVSDFDDGDDELLVFDFVEDAVDALADSVALLAGESLAGGRAGIFGELGDSLEDANLILLWDVSRGQVTKSALADY